jgi:hypothetical protein
MTRLTVADIRDLREYERERDAFRAEVIALKKIRRIAIGPLVSVVFENRTTIRFQIQEMARAERMTTDAQVEAELAVYGPLIPGPGEISLTLFLELVTEEQLRTWLPALVGIERSMWLHVGGVDVRADVDPAHAAQLTRDEVTASVHYVRFSLPAAAQSRLVEGPASIAVDLPAYQHEAELPEVTRASLAADWASA